MRFSPVRGEGTYVESGGREKRFNPISRLSLFSRTNLSLLSNQPWGGGGGRKGEKAIALTEEELEICAAGGTFFEHTHTFPSLFWPPPKPSPRPPCVYLCERIRKEEEEKAGEKKEEEQEIGAPPPPPPPPSIYPTSAFLRTPHRSTRPAGERERKEGRKGLFAVRKRKGGERAAFVPPHRW